LAKAEKLIKGGEAFFKQGNRRDKGKLWWEKTGDAESTGEYRLGQEKGCCKFNHFREKTQRNITNRSGMEVQGQNKKKKKVIYPPCSTKTLAPQKKRRQKNAANRVLK